VAVGAAIHLFSFPEANMKETPDFPPEANTAQIASLFHEVGLSVAFLVISMILTCLRV
jgi:hypothetical protein